MNRPRAARRGLREQDAKVVSQGHRAGGASAADCQAVLEGVAGAALNCPCRRLRWTSNSQRWQRSWRRASVQAASRDGRCVGESRRPRCDSSVLPSSSWMNSESLRPNQRSITEPKRGAAAGRSILLTPLVPRSRAFPGSVAKTVERQRDPQRCGDHRGWVETAVRRTKTERRTRNACARILALHPATGLRFRGSRRDEGLARRIQSLEGMDWADGLHERPTQIRQRIKNARPKKRGNRPGRAVHQPRAQLRCSTRPRAFRSSLPRSGRKGREIDYEIVRNGDPIALRYSRELTRPRTKE